MVFLVCDDPVDGLAVAPVHSEGSDISLIDPQLEALDITPVHEPVRGLDQLGDGDGRPGEVPSPRFGHHHHLFRCLYRNWWTG
jgi:hypothetical protein